MDRRVALAALLVVVAGGFLLLQKRSAAWSPIEPVKSVTLNKNERQVSKSAIAPVIATKTMPSSREAQVISEYAQAAKCAKVNQTRSFMEFQLKSPNSWVNNDAARRQLTPEELQSVEDNLLLVQRNAAICDRLGGGFARVYETALAAALMGDADASACYVYAQWPASEGNDGIDPRLLADYERYAPKLAERGLRAGDWRMVELLIMAHISTTPGMLSRLQDADPAMLYALKVLKRLGATDKKVATPLDAQLPLLRKEISVEQAKKAEDWASLYFKSYFLKSGPAPEGVVGCEACDCSDVS